MISIVVPVVLLIFLVGIFIYQVNKLLDLTSLTQRRYANIAQAIDMQKSLIDMEVGSRGFAMSRNKIYLQPWTEGHEHYPQIYLHLRKSLISADQVVQLDKVHDLAGQWQDQTQKRIDAYDQGHFENAKALENAEFEGKK